MAGGADILLETWPPGAADRLGLGYEQLSGANPALVVTSITGFPATGPYRDVQGYEALVMARSGALGQFGSLDAATGPLLPPAPAGRVRAVEVRGRGRLRCAGAPRGRVRRVGAPLARRQPRDVPDVRCHDAAGTAAALPQPVVLRRQRGPGRPDRPGCGGGHDRPRGGLCGAAGQPARPAVGRAPRGRLRSGSSFGPSTGPMQGASRSRGPGNCSAGTRSGHGGTSCRLPEPDRAARVSR